MEEESQLNYLNRLTLLVALSFIIFVVEGENGSKCKLFLFPGH